MVSAPPLPIVNPILGRKREIDQVLSLLDGDSVRVLSLLGPDGVGKTRLVQEVARIVAQDFAHGVGFVPLASIRDPGLVPKAVAEALGIQENSVHDATALLTEILADRHLLLVLDNLEQVIAAAPWLAELLARCARLKVLVTSRIALDIADEQRFVVSALPVPVAGDVHLDENAAIRLFVLRAQAVDFAFQLSDETSAAVAEICRRLDGLPLAIELAAARIKVLSPEAILARLTNRLTLLTGGRRDVPARLQSMRDAIGWSYDLLSELDQRLFRQLSVCNGGFSLESATFVANWPESMIAEDAVMESIGRLVDHSLVQANTGGPDSRFLMLETIREYGLQEIATSGQDDLPHLAHAEYYRQLADQAQRALIGPEQGRWLNLLDAELPNIRSAMTWLEGHDRVDDAILLNARIAWFLNIRGHTVESLQRLDAWLRLPALATRTRSRGLALLGSGGLKQNLGDLVTSATMLVEATDILRDVSDEWHLSMALSILGATYYQLGDLERMQAVAMESSLFAEQVGNSRAIASNLGHLAEVASLSGDRVLATELQQRSARVTLDAGDRWLIAFRGAGQCADELQAGNLDRAAHLALEAKDLFEELGDKRDLPGAWGEMAWIARKRGDLETAEDYAATGLAIAEACGHSWYVVRGRLLLGTIAAERGMLAQSIAALSTALALVNVGAQHLDAADFLDAFAVLAARAGDSERAVRFLGAAEARMREAGIEQENWNPDPPSSGVVGDLRARLGEVEFGRLLAEGAALSPDEAVAEAFAYTLPDSQLTWRQESTVSAAERHGLSPRELDVLRLMANGLSNQQTADELFLSLRTVTTHVTGILGKLDLPSRTAAVSFAIRNGIAWFPFQLNHSYVVRACVLSGAMP